MKSGLTGTLSKSKWMPSRDEGSLSTISGNGDGISAGPAASSALTAATAASAEPTDVTMAWRYAGNATCNELRPGLGDSGRGVNATVVGESVKCLWSKRAPLNRSLAVIQYRHRTDPRRRSRLAVDQPLSSGKWINLRSVSHVIAAGSPSAARRMTPANACNLSDSASARISFP